MSKNTTAVFAGEKAGSKRAKAESLGLPVWSEAQLVEALGSPSVVLEWLASASAEDGVQAVEALEPDASTLRLL